MSNLGSIKISLENSFVLIEHKMAKLNSNVQLADIWSRYIKAKRNNCSGSEAENKKKIEDLKNELTIYAIKALKISDLILNEINDCINTLQNNKNTCWYSSLFNRVVEMKKELNNKIFDAKSLKDKFGNNKIAFKDINLDEDEYTYKWYNLVSIGIDFDDYDYADFEKMSKKYGNVTKSNMDIIHNGYTQRCSSFDLNRKLRKGQLLDSKEIKIFSAINSACNNNKLEKNIYLFRFVDQEFIKKYNIEFNRLSKISISNALFKFKNNIIDKNIKEKESGFISSSCDINKNVFRSRDILLILYVEKGCNLYATNNEQESEIILSPGMIYHFFDCYFIERKLYGEACYQMIIKTFVKNYY